MSGMGEIIDRLEDKVEVQQRSIQRLRKKVKDRDAEVKRLKWVSCKWATCFVEVENGIIKDTANIWRKFIGQPFNNLKKWLKNPEVKEICNNQPNKNS